VHAAATRQATTTTSNRRHPRPRAPAVGLATARGWRRATTGQPALGLVPLAGVLAVGTRLARGGRLVRLGSSCCRGLLDGRSPLWGSAACPTASSNGTTSPGRGACACASANCAPITRSRQGQHATPLPGAGQFHAGPVQPFQQLEELAGDGPLGHRRTSRALLPCDLRRAAWARVCGRRAGVPARSCAAPGPARQHPRAAVLRSRGLDLGRVQADC
jgi:hypothetical protein